MVSAFAERNEKNLSHFTSHFFSELCYTVKSRPSQHLSVVVQRKPADHLQLPTEAGNNRGQLNIP